MAIAGQLEVQLYADVARLRQDMSRATGIVTSGAQSIERAANTAKAALLGMMAGVSVTAFAGMVKGAIDAADHLNKLTQRTGVAVESLSQLQYAAKLADVSTDSLTTGLKKLNVSIANGIAGEKEKVAQFKALGITLTDTAGRAKTADQVLIEMADAFEKSKDGAGKAAVAVGLLGKAGDEMIPMLNAGGQALRDMMKEADQLGLTIGAEFAAQAEQFNDNLTRLKTGVQQLAISLASDVVDALGRVIQELTNARLASDGDNSFAAILGKSLRVVIETLAVLGANVSFVFQGIGREIGAIAAQAGALARLDFDAFRAISAAVKEDGERARKELDAVEKRLLGIGGNATPAAKVEERTKEIKLANDHAKAIKGISEAEKDLIYHMEFRRKALLAEHDAQVKADEAAKKASDSLLASREKMFDAMEKAEQSAKDMLDQIKFEGKLIGLTNQQRTVAITLRQLEKTGIDQTTEAYQKLRAEIEQQIRDNVQAQAGIDAAKKVEEEWERTNQQIADSFVDNLMRGGKSVAQYLKDLFRTLVLRPLLQPVGNMMAAGVNGVMGGGAAAMDGSGLGGSLMSGAANYLGATAVGGSLAAGFSGASAALAGGSTFGVTGAIGGYSAAIGTGATGVAGAASSIASGASAAMAAIPVAGWVALAAVALWSIFGKKGGGPKDESAFNYNYAGTSTPIASVAGMPQGGIAQQISETIETTYAGIAKQLGLEGDALKVGIIVAQDPKGTAQTILGVETSAGYSRSDRLGGIENVGRSDEELKAAIAEETIRAIFDALKASDLSNQYKAWLNEVTGGVAEMQAAMDHVILASAEKQQLEALLFDLTATDIEKLNKVRDAERAAVDESNLALLEQVYAMQDLKRATESTTKSLADQSDLARNIAGSYVEYMRLMGRINAGIPITGGRLPGYADGGTASGWSMVGERGPEIVDFSQPGQVYTAEQTQGMFSGGSGLAPLLAEVRDELRAIRAEDGARGDVIKGASLKTAEVLSYIKTNGMPLGEDLLAGG